MTVLRLIRRGITAQELREELAECDPNAIVVFACDYGDICHTKQALPISRVEELDENALYESAYSNSGVAVVDDEDDDDDEDTRKKLDNPKPVVILR